MSSPSPRAPATPSVPYAALASPPVGHPSQAVGLADLGWMSPVQVDALLAAVATAEEEAAVAADASAVNKGAPPPPPLTDARELEEEEAILVQSWRESGDAAVTG